ncbi:hypothetical protein BDQ12DRAFT_716594 [Crucibulum laeve]|uniref:Rhodopsin domain-containing protein n=1 Tax=Crucibulum laeve TaxID=68775 RepID=A0A5C3LGX7_9AGAR|nr:hypothetical protein BDQ12DRAFT_716594 [Crucibulum laeve]
MDPCNHSLTAMIPAQPVLPWKVSICVLHLIAALSSVIRVYYRHRTRRLWWDDYASIVPAVFECFTAVVIWLRLRSFDDSEHSRRLKVTYSYMNTAAFGFVIWWSRISLALAVVRITPVWSKTRPWVIGFTCAFVLNWIVIVLGMTLNCVVNEPWKYLKGNILTCGPARVMTLLSVTTDIIGDMLLVGFPLYRLWSITLRPAQRRLVLLVFSTSVLTLVAATAVAIVSYGSLLKGPGVKLVWLMTVNIEQSISVIACNLPVLISWGYRVFSCDDDNESGDHITPHWSHIAPGGLSMPTFVPTDSSGNHSQTSENGIQISASDTSLHSEIKTQQDESVIEEWKTVEGVLKSTSGKYITV